jgi:prevent-host-death family protein
MSDWALQDAKARLSELIKRAQLEGPQRITLRGEPAAVVIAKAEYDRLAGPRPGLVEFLRASPLAGISLDIERDKSPARDVEL